MVLTDLDVELGVENVQQVLDDYLMEDALAVWDLIRAEPGLTGSEIPEIVEAVVESAEAMEVDQPLVLMAEPMHLPMDTRLPKTQNPSGNFPTGAYRFEIHPIFDRQSGHSSFTHYGCR